MPVSLLQGQLSRELLDVGSCGHLRVVQPVAWRAPDSKGHGVEAIGRYLEVTIEAEAVGAVRQLREGFHAVFAGMFRYAREDRRNFLEQAGFAPGALLVEQLRGGVLIQRVEY